MLSRTGSADLGRFLIVIFSAAKKSQNRPESKSSRKKLGGKKKLLSNYYRRILKTLGAFQYLSTAPITAKYLTQISKSLIRVFAMDNLMSNHYFLPSSKTWRQLLQT